MKIKNILFFFSMGIYGSLFVYDCKEFLYLRKWE